MSGWKVTLVHGPESEDEETFDDLEVAMEWAQMQGSHYHKIVPDCLADMKGTFEKEFGNGSFQYGTNYHWVTFEKI